MEVIYTKYSPNEKVIWKRVDKGVEKISEHTISSIRTETRYTYTYKSINGKLKYAKGVWYSFLSFVNGHNRRKGSDYGKMANECFESVKKGEELHNNKISTIIYYYLQGIGEPVQEEQLESITIIYSGKDAITTQL